MRRGRARPRELDYAPPDSLPTAGCFFPPSRCASVGAVMVFSASAVTAREQYRQRVLFSDPAGFVARIWNRGDADSNECRLSKNAPARGDFHVASVVLLMLVAVFFLDKSHATHRWIRIGALGFQPSEIAKLAVILYLGWFLSERMSQGPEVMNDWRRTLMPALAPVVLIAASFVCNPILAQQLRFSVIALVMLFVSGISLKWVLVPAAAVLPVSCCLVIFVAVEISSAHVGFDILRRIRRDTGFQLLQSLIAVGSGGLSGVGLMESRQKLFYLPEAHTDFIFAVLCEELGFIGGLIVLGLFAVYAWRGMRAALEFNRSL